MILAGAIERWRRDRKAARERVCAALNTFASTITEGDR